MNMSTDREKEILDEEAEAGITLAEVLRLEESSSITTLLDMLKNPEIEESLDQKAASGITHAQKLADLFDYFDTDGMFESIGEMNNQEKSQQITSVLTYISGYNKYLPRSNGAESNFAILDTYFDYAKLKYRYHVPTAIWMQIAVAVFSTLNMYKAKLKVKEIDNSTDYSTEYQQQWEKYYKA
eukprot:jgi/Psemu1/24383/gm1.24383_g